MDSTTLPQAVHDCLQNDMQIDMDHFYSKYEGFDNSFKEIANKLLLSYLNASNQPSPFNDIEYETGTIHQSWTTDFDTAKRYAFEHFHDIDKSKRIVLKANVSPTQIVWLRTIDNEVVLKSNPELLDLELLERYN